ncbi:hypothetical protein [Microbacterium xanthum]|uniref:hypothetical protein n=1 Tax=Microbacterium xanthum TaxID=3079794 RepID=UPI002AD3C447|nr:hypothetical protein [Microbacterium sp. KSW-48]MDZ8173005.1 hypothetical protein [Microbacterium sp. KSW-48]
MNRAGASNQSPRAVDAARTVPGAVFAVLVSGALALVLAWTAMSLLRLQLHVGCSMGKPGSEGAYTWICSDGIGYLGFAIVFGAIWMFAVPLGALAAALIRHERSARVALVALATTTAAAILASTNHWASRLVDDLYSPMTGEQYWQQAVGPAALVCSVSLAVATIGLVFRGRIAVVLTLAAAAGVVGSVVLQPGLSINLLPVVGLLAAAAMRAMSPSLRQRP